MPIVVCIYSCIIHICKIRFCTLVGPERAALYYVSAWLTLKLERVINRERH